MKKIIFGAAAIALLFSSCDTSTKDSTSMNLYKVYNHIFSKTTGEITTSQNIYSVELNWTQGTVAISTKDLKIDNKDNSFTTTPGVIGEVKTYNTSEGVAQTMKFERLTGNFNDDSSMPLQNFRAKWSSALNVPTYSELQNSGVQAKMNPLILSYEIGNEYMVRTFQVDCFYKGSTNTSFVAMDGQSGTYQNTNMLYRVILDVDKKKGDVQIFKAKFAEQQPEISLIAVKGLDLTFNSEGYVLKGENIVPGVVENGKETPNDKYIFNQIEFVASGPELTQGFFSFKVADRFTGRFVGDYMMTETKK